MRPPSQRISLDLLTVPLRIAFCFVLGMLLVADGLRAQSAAPIPISGTVSATDGAPIARAEIRLLDPNTNAVLADRIFTDETGTFSADPDIVVSAEDEVAVPTAFAVLPLYPNPLAATGQRVALRYTTPLNKRVEPTVEVLDVLGRRVGGTLAAGLYFVRLRLEDGRVTAPQRFVVAVGGRLDLAMEQVTALGSDGQPAQTATSGQPPSAASMAALRAFSQAHGSTVTLETRRDGFVSDSRPLDLTGTTTGLVVSLAVAGAPTASFTVSANPQAAEVVTFDGSASSGDGPLTYAWTFETSDATRRGGGAQVSQLFAEGGDVRVTLTVASRFGATASTTQTISVGALPTPVAQVPTVVRVTDTRGARVPEARVKLVGTTLEATANPLGEAAFAAFDVGVPRSIQVSAEGYAAQTVPVTLPEGTARGYVDVTLLQRAQARSMPDAELGGTMMAADGAMVALPVEGLVDAAGNTVSGEIDVFVTPVDVADADERAGFPGQFAGVQPDGERGLISSYGTVEYVFEQDGQELQLAPGKSATVEIPIYTGGAEVGDTIALWSVDEETGLWVQEGTGTVVESDASPTGLALRATVTHFSWWNCDRFEEANPETGLCWENQCSTGVCQRVPVGCWTKGGPRPGAPRSDGTNEEEPVFEVRTFIPEGGTEIVLPVGSEVVLAATAIGENGDLLTGRRVASSTGEIVEIDLFPAQPTGAPIPTTLPLTLTGESADAGGSIVLYTFEGTAETNLFLNATRTSGAVGTVILRDPDNLPVAGFPYGSNTEPTFTVLPKTGTYKLLVAPDGIGAFEVNASVVTTTPLGGLPVVEPLSFVSEGAQAFTFQAVAGEEASFVVARGTGSARGRVLLRTPSGQLLTETEFSFTSQANISRGDRLLRFPETGTYAAFLVNEGDAGDVVLGVRPVGTFGVDTQQTGALQPFEVAYFRFDAEPGGYRAFLTNDQDSEFAGATPAFLDTDGAYINPARPFSGTSVASGIASIPERGPAYLRIASDFSEFGGTDYKLSLSRIPEPTPLAFDALGTAILDGELTLPSAVAVFSADAAAGSVVTTLEATGATPLGSFYTLQAFEGTPADVTDPGQRLFPDETQRDPAIDLVEGLAIRSETTRPLLFYVVIAQSFGNTSDRQPGTFRVAFDRAPVQDTYVVDDDGADCANADVRSLKAALKAAPEGATITACAGTYASVFDHRFEASNTTLRGTDRDAVVVTNRSGLVAPFNGNTFAPGLAGGTIEDLTFETTDRNRIPVTWRLPGGTLRNLTVRAADTVTETLAFGISLGNDGHLIENVAVADPTSSAALGGFVNDVTVRASTFNGPIQISGDRNVIDGNTIRSTQSDNGITYRGGGATITDNVIEATGVFSGTQALAVDVDPVIAGEERASVVRGNRIVTSARGTRLVVGNAPAALIFEQNLVRSTADSGEQILLTSPGRTDGSGSLVVRNNVFDGVRGFDGLRFGNLNLWTEPFAFVNNTIRVEANAQTSSALALVEAFPAPPPGDLVAITNNIFVGQASVQTGDQFVFDASDSDGSGAALDVDYNLFFNFDAVFQRGSSSTGTSNLFGLDPRLTGDLLELGAGSAALDLGATPAQYDAVPDVDFDGTARPQGAGYDIGAHERE